MIFPKKLHWNMIFLVVLSRKMIFLLHENIILFFRRKMKDDLSQELHGDMIFSACMYKCYKYDITFLQKKSKVIFSQKNTLKAD